MAGKTTTNQTIKPKHHVRSFNMKQLRQTVAFFLEALPFGADDLKPEHSFGDFIDEIIDKYFDTEILDFGEYYSEKVIEYCVHRFVEVWMPGPMSAWRKSECIGNGVSRWGV